MQEKNGNSDTFDNRYGGKLVMSLMLKNPYAIAGLDEVNYPQGVAYNYPPLFLQYILNVYLNDKYKANIHNRD